MNMKSFQEKVGRNLSGVDTSIAMIREEILNRVVGDTFGLEICVEMLQNIKNERIGQFKKEAYIAVRDECRLPVCEMLTRGFVYNPEDIRTIASQVQDFELSRWEN